MNKKPVRKNIRLQGYDYAQAGYYFVTICVADKKPILSKIHSNRVGTRVGTDVPVCPLWLMYNKKHM